MKSVFMLQKIRKYMALWFDGDISTNTSENKYLSNLLIVNFKFEFFNPLVTT